MHEFSLENDGIEIVKRGIQYYLRYDAGAHMVCWREDEISENDVSKIKSGKDGEYEVIVQLQKRLMSLGIDPYVSNWKPD